MPWVEEFAPQVLEEEDLSQKDQVINEKGFADYVENSTQYLG